MNFNTLCSLRMTPYLSLIRGATSLIFGSVLFSYVVTQANADLVISEPSQQITSIVQNPSSQSYNKQATNIQVPSDNSVIKLMQVMHIDEQIQSIINGQHLAIDVIDAQTDKAQQVDDEKLNKRQRELQTQIQAILGQYAEIMGETIGEATDEQTLTQAYINAAKAHYTQAEVDAQIEFYDSAIGQSILEKQPQVSSAFLKQSLPKNMNDSKDKLADLLPQMQQIFKGIF